MTFWDRLKQIWIKHRYDPTSSQIESLRKDLRWSKARLAIKQTPDYPIFRDWLEDMIFKNWKNYLSDPENVVIGEAINSIITKIEDTTSDQIDIDEKNLKALQERMNKRK